MLDLCEIKAVVEEVAKQYGVERVYLFGSYARNEATTESDLDFRIDGGAIRGLFEFSGFRLVLEEKLHKSVDVVTTRSLDDDFIREIQKEEILIYEQTQAR